MRKDARSADSGTDRTLWKDLTASVAWIVGAGAGAVVAAVLAVDTADQASFGFGAGRAAFALWVLVAIFSAIVAWQVFLIVQLIRHRRRSR